MTRKSKKSLSNKLAKMSDEERMKYLKKKADAEEEVKRRREQLISTFIKSKIRKEDGYARLNVAKINQQWHQIKRKQKCKEMKKDVENLRKWIAIVFSFKDRSINFLLKKLNENEEQYRYNLRGHFMQMDKVIDQQRDYLIQLHRKYEQDRNEIVATIQSNKSEVLRNTEKSNEYLKSLIFGNNEELETFLTKNKKNNLEKQANLIAEYQVMFEKTVNDLNKLREQGSQLILNLISNFINRTDLNRAHYQQLLKLDMEYNNSCNEDYFRIQKKKMFLNHLKTNLVELKNQRTDKIEKEQQRLHNLQLYLSNSRKAIQLGMKEDERKLFLLSECTYDITKFMEDKMNKGESILKLIEICEKEEKAFQKHEQQLNLISTYSNNEIETKDVSADSTSVENGEEIPEVKHTIQNTIYSKKFIGLEACFERINPDSSFYFEATKPQSKELSSIRKKKLNEKYSTDPDILVDIENKLHQIDSEPFPPNDLDQDENNRELNEEVLCDDFETLEDLGNFWNKFNNVKIHCIYLKEEKKKLVEENEALKALLKNLLKESFFGY